jgi:hypothetical protein
LHFLWKRAWIEGHPYKYIMDQASNNDDGIVFEGAEEQAAVVTAASCLAFEASSVGKLS